MSFKKSFDEARQAYKPMRRSQMKRTKMVVRSGRLKAGKKTKQWASIRAILKRKFEAVGITTCELHRVGSALPHLCTYDNYLGFAHNAKRRKLTDADLYHVILICNNAHDIIEVWPPEEMKRIVNGTIHARDHQP